MAKLASIKAAQKFFSEDKDRAFEAKVRLVIRGRRNHFIDPLCSQMMDESSRLLTTQQQLEKDSDGKIAFFGLSVNETIRTCVMNGMAKRADKIKSDFKVPDKRYARRLQCETRTNVVLDLRHQFLVREAPCAH